MGLRLQSIASNTAIMLGVFIAGCSSYHPVDPRNMPYKGLESLATANEIVIAYETARSCSLESATGAEPPMQGWTPVRPNQLASKRFRILDRKLHQAAGGTQIDYLALRVSGADNSTLWLRNAPTSNSREAVSRWHCAVDTDFVNAHAPKLRAKVVRLNTGPGSCPTIVPIIGSRDDVTFSPYTVTGFGLFAGAAQPARGSSSGAHGQIAVGVRLEAEGGERRLTVPTNVFDQCFVNADKPPPPPGETKALMGWLLGKTPDSTDPPTASIETFAGVTGTNLEQCKREGSDQAKHYECRSPVLRIQPVAGAGPFGPPILQLTRERLIDAVHIYNGALVPASDVVSVNVAVRMPKLPAGSTFGRVLEQAITESIEDPRKRIVRGASGFRIVPASNKTAGAMVTHYVDLDVTYNIPDLETTVETKTGTYIAGKKNIPNPDHDTAQKEVEAAESDLPNKERNLELAKKAIETAKAGCDKAANQLGGWGGLLASAGCSAGSTAGVTAAESSLQNARTRIVNAKQTLASTPEELTVDDERTFTYQAKTLRRKGEALAHLTITPAGRGGVAQLTTDIKVPFDASDVEIPDDPAHKLVGKAANPPSVEDAERTLAQALIQPIDNAIVRWGNERQIGGDIGELKPGTRSWMVAVARRAASDRPVKLLSDIFENREDVLKLSFVTYPVKLPKGSETRCYTFAAIPADGKADLNLEFGFAGPKGSKRFVAIGKDARQGQSSAAFELCEVPPGDYSVGLWLGGGVPSLEGVLLALFDSTPNAVTNEDTRASSKGLPSTPRKGEALVLNGSGVVEYRGIANRQIRGTTGDRDGDGVADELDRCPYDPETTNGYLDEDGCPDERPAGWKSPPSATAANANADHATRPPSTAPVAPVAPPGPAPKTTTPPAPPASAAPPPAPAPTATPAQRAKPVAKPAPAPTQPTKPPGKKGPAVFIP